MNDQSDTAEYCYQGKEKNSTSTSIQEARKVKKEDSHFVLS